MTGFKVFAFSSTFWGLIRCCCGVGQFQEADPESCRGVFCHGIRRVFQITQQTTYKDMSCFSTMPKKYLQFSNILFVFLVFGKLLFIYIWICIFHHIYIYICNKNHEKTTIHLKEFPWLLTPAVAGQHQAVALVDEAFGLQKGPWWHRSVIFWG